MIKIGMIITDRYEILEKIGTGGMSDVYKAKDSKLNRFVAVKVLKQEFSENANFVSKFRTEAQAAAGMMHPNIVNVYDVGEEGGIHYIVMELVEGITLKKYIEKKSRLSIKETISIAIQVSMGIEAAHNNHIIHRDIKPQNIMISKEGKVKVTDFGIAKAVSSNTITSNVMGSVHYTSPEQARGGFSDEKSDIYSLGVTMFEMLTGRVPFNGETTVAIAIKHIQDKMPSPREYVAEIPISVEQIIFKCTQKSPDRRYQNMAELIEDLKRSLMQPDEDFVKIIDPDEEAATKMVGANDVRQIREQARLATGEIRMRTNEPDRIRNTGNIKLQNSGTSKSGAATGKGGSQQGAKSSGNGKSGSGNSKNASASKNGKKNSGKNAGAKNNNQAARKKRPEDVRAKKPVKGSQEEHDENLERITTICAVIAAIVIGCTVIYLIGRYGFGLFTSSPDADETVTEEVVPTDGVTDDITPEVIEEDDTNAVVVPSVVNLSYAEAVATLNKVGLNVQKADMTSETVRKGDIVQQSPEQGTKVARGTTVTVSVSTGSEVVETKVPNVVGMDEMTATATLIEHGLKVGKVSEETNPDENLAGKVFYQSYAEGMSVNSGTAVDIKISSGTGKVTYSFVGNVESPSNEDDAYTAGSEATVILTTSAGEELKRETTSSFPVPMNVSGISGSEEGTITIIYKVTIPGQTTVDENGNQLTTQDSVEERKISRNVKFSQE